MIYQWDLQLGSNVIDRLQRNGIKKYISNLVLRFPARIYNHIFAQLSTRNSQAVGLELDTRSYRFT